MPTVLKEKKGLSIVEVMVAVLVLLIMLIGSSFLFVYGKSKIKQQGDYRIAAQIAAQRIEQLKAGDYSAIPKDQTQESLSSGDLSCSRITEVTAQDGGSYKEVKVTVLWGPEHDRHNVSLISCIAPK